MREPSIITVGICPAWDITCYAAGLEWGDHKPLERQTVIPAGKALNISRALAWMGIENTAAGLWGREDFESLQKELSNRLIHLHMTLAAGRTRQNITVADTKNHREMHLRTACKLATEQSLEQLTQSLLAVVQDPCIVVFAGSLPSVKHSGRILGLLERLHNQNAHIVLDTSGPIYRTIVDSIPLLLIKPNLEELSELAGKSVEDTPAEIIRAARPLCKRSQYVVVSRGANGAILVGPEKAFLCKSVPETNPANTVGCGDFLLAGLLANMANGPDQALATGIKAAAARASGLYPETPWKQAERDIAVQSSQL